LAGPAQQTRRVVNVPVVEDRSSGAWEAAAQAASALGEVARRIEKADIDRKVTEADRKTREDIDREYRKLETDGTIDAATIETRFKEASDAVISKNAEIVPQGAKAMWTERAKTQWQSNGVLKARDLTRKRQLTDMRAGIIKESAALQAAIGDMAIEEKTFVESVNAQRNLIGRQAQSGVLEKDDAALQLAQLDKWIVDDKTARVTANVDALVRDGRVAEAEAQFKANYKELDPAKRQAIEKGLQDAKFDARVVTMTDDLWAKAEGDYGRFVKETGKIEDARLRTQVEERGNRLRLMADQAENEHQDGLEEAMWAHVEGGGKIGNAPPSLRAEIDPDRLGSIRAFENARDAEGTMGYTEKQFWKIQSTNFRNELETMLPERFVAGYDKWSTDARRKFDNLTLEDQQAVRDEITKRRIQGQVSQPVDASMTELTQELKRVAPEDWKIGTQNQKKEATEVLGLLRGYAKDQAATGKPITKDETRDFIARAMGSRGFAAPGQFGLAVNDLIGTGMEGMVGAGQLDPDIIARIEDTFYRNTGNKPTPAETMAIYRQIEAAQ
jgi:hypothetical protein